MTKSLDPNRPEPAPVHDENTGRAIWPLVIEDMGRRDADGIVKYGKALRAFDGRKSLVDAYQEALDLAVYIRKEIEEQRLRAEEASAALELGLLVHAEIPAWQAKTFPGTHLSGAVRHMAKEVAELSGAVEDLERIRKTSHPIDLEKSRRLVVEEIADVVFMAIQAMTLAGSDMGCALIAKLAKNMARTWKAPDVDGVVEHAAEGA